MQSLMQPLYYCLQTDYPKVNTVCNKANPYTMLDFLYPNLFANFANPKFY